MTITTLQCGMGWFPQQTGGLNRVYYNLTHHLAAVEVTIRGLVAGRPIDGAPHVHAFAPADAPLPVRWWLVRRAASGVLQSGPIDLVASHFALYTFPLLDALGRLPLVVHFHGPWADEVAVERGGRRLRGARRALERAVYRRADRAVVLSEAFADVLHRGYGVPLDRIRVVPGGVDVERFATNQGPTEARRLLGWPADRPVVLVVRRLARRMGLATLLEAASLLRRRVPDALVHIVGRGPLAETLQRRIEEAGLADNVRLLGFLPDETLPLAYRAATLSVVPTEALEGFGLITVESLAAGTPVLVTPVGGLPEVVRDLDPALVFDDAGAPAMADRLAAALRGRLVLPSADACRTFARDRFGWPQVARRTRSVYEEVL